MRLGPNRAAWRDPVLLASLPLLLALLIALTPTSGRQLLLLLIFAPLTEEIVFREGLQQWLWRRGWSAQAAGLTVTLGFGLVHALTRSPWLGLAVLPPAYALGWLYTRTAKVWHCVVAHAAMNAIWLILTGNF